MANVLRFEVKTDAPYSPSEVEDLENDFFEFIKDIDPDVIEATEKVSVMTEEEAKGELSPEQKRDIVQDFLKKSNFNVSVTIVDDSDEDVHTVSLSD